MIWNNRLIKKSFIVILTAFFSLNFLLVPNQGFALSPVVYDQNLLINPSFDVYTGTNGVADGWTKSLTPGAVDQFSVYSDSYRSSGSKAQIVQASSLANGGTASLYQEINVSAGLPYSASGRLGISSVINAKVRVSVEFFKANGQFIDRNQFDHNGVTYGYVSSPLIGSTPPEAVKARFGVHIISTGSNASAAVFVDDMNFQITNNRSLSNNSGFEKNTNVNPGLADGWGSWVSVGATNQFQQVSTPINSGNFAQKVSGSALAINQAVMLTQDIFVEENREFNLDWNINISQLGPNTKVITSIVFYDEAHLNMGGRVFTHLTTTSGYMKGHIEGVIPKGSKRAKLHYYLSATQAAGYGTFHLDNVNLSYANLLQNPSFDSYTGTNGVADGWEKFLTPGAVDQFAVYADSYRSSGSKAQIVQASSLPVGGTASLYQEINVSPGVQYSASGRLGISSVVNAQIRISVDFFNANGQFISRDQFEHNGITYGYVTSPLTGFTPLETARVRFGVHIVATGANASGTVFVDDMNFQRTDNRNLFNNPSFERNSNVNPGISDGWGNWVSAGATNQFQQVSSPIGTGYFAQKVSGSSLALNQAVMLTQDVYVEENREFKLDWKINISQLGPNTKVITSIVFYNEEHLNMGGKVFTYQAATSGYVNGQIEGVVPNGSKRAKLHIYLSAAQSDAYGTFFLDDISFTYSNLLQNPSFESYTGANAVADGWSKTIGNGGIDQFQIYQDNYRSSGKRVQIVKASNLPSGEKAILRQEISVIPGKSYVLKGRLSIGGDLVNSKARLTIEFYDASNSLLGINYYDRSEATYTYVTVPLTGTIPTGTSKARISVSLIAIGSNATGTIFVDDMHFLYSTDNNSLVNPGFEVNSSMNFGVADGWLSWNVPGSSDTNQQLSAVVAEGSFAQRGQILSIPQNGGGTIYQNILIEPNRAYILTSKIKITSLNPNTKVIVGVDFINGTYQHIGTNRSIYSATTSGFIDTMLEGVTPPGAVFAQVFFYARGSLDPGVGSATYYIDAVKLNLESVPLNFNIYNYDINGRLDNIVLPNGEVIDYQYDTNGNLLRRILVE